MTQQTTGSTRRPARQYHVPRRTGAPLAAGLIWLAVSFPPFVIAAEREEAIFCGAPLARELAAGATDTFRSSLLPGTVVSVDVIATANLGLLKLRSTNFSPATETCRGELLLTSTSEAGSGVAGSVQVSDCLVPPAARDYTLSLSVVSQGADNCAVSVPCGSGLNAGFETRGEVDSYTFPGTEGEEVSLTVTNISAPISQVRLRLFDPSGASISDDVDTCPGSLRVTLPTTGSYTALVSSCTGAKNGTYTITWQPPTCTPSTPPGRFAYITHADSGTLSVIDLATNTAKASIPIAPPGLAQIAAPTYIAITPNGGFAYATYGPSSAASVINTSKNLVTATVPSGLDAAGVAVSPDGATAYVLSNSLEGIVLVDTKTNKVTRVVAQAELGFSQGIAVSPDGTALYVLSEDRGGLVKINATTFEPDGFTDVDIGVNDAFAVSPDGSFIYAGTLDGIVVVDTALFTKTATIPLGEPFAIAFTADGLSAYATIVDAGTVAAINAIAHTAIASIPVTDSPGGIAISPETALAYVTDFTAAANEAGMFVIDTRTNKIIGTIATLGDGPVGIALTTAPTGLCVGDVDGDTKVTVDELVLSVNYLLNGCPGRFPSLSIPFP